MKKKLKLSLVICFIFIFAMSPLLAACGKANQSPLVITAVSAKTYGDADFNLVVTGGSGNGEVTFERTYGTAATVSESGLVHIVGVGIIKVKASKAADETHNKIASDELTITIEKGLGSGTLTMASWHEGESVCTPAVSSTTHDALSVEFSYKLKNAADSEYSNVAPTTTGEYVVRAVLAENNLYSELVLTQEFSILEKLNLDIVIEFDGFAMETIEFSVKRTGYYLVSYSEEYDYSGIYDSDNNLVFVQNSYDCDGYSYMAYLEEGETYFLEITPDEEDSTCLVSIILLNPSECGTDIDTAKEIVLNETYSFISTAGEVSYFAFTPEEDNQYCFESFSNYDTMISIYKHDGLNYVMHDEIDDNGVGYNFKLITYLNKNITYYILLSYFDGDSGFATFKVKEYVPTPGETFSTAFNLNLEQQVDVEIIDYSPVHFYFVPTDSAYYMLDIMGDYFGYANIVFFDETESPITQFSAMDVDSSIVFAYLTAGNRYYFVIYTSYSNCDDFVIELSRFIPSQGESFETAVQVNQDVTIDTQSTVFPQFYSFIPTATGFYYLLVENVANFWVRIYDENYNELGGVFYDFSDYQYLTAYAELTEGKVYYYYIYTNDDIEFSFVIQTRSAKLLDNLEYLGLADLENIIIQFGNPETHRQDFAFWDLNGLFTESEVIDILNQIATICEQNLNLNGEIDKRINTLYLMLCFEYTAPNGCVYEFSMYYYASQNSSESNRGCIDIVVDKIA